MNFEKLVPNIFYVDIAEGLKLFVDCLSFNIGHDELKSCQPFCVLEKNDLRINLFENAALAREHSPGFRLVTKILKKFMERFPNLILNFFIQTLRKLRFAHGVLKNLH